jgi:Cu(I)/Ag(I) efflux system membrane protein CusA/SilA
MPRFRGDPAPTEMIETVINLKPRSEWRAGLTVDGLIADLDKQLPGISNAWTMPIKARTDMLATGIRTPIGIKVLGTHLVEMEKLARKIETVVKAVRGTFRNRQPADRVWVTYAITCGNSRVPPAE